MVIRAPLTARWEGETTRNTGGESSHRIAGPAVFNLITSISRVVKPFQICVGSGWISQHRPHQCHIRRHSELCNKVLGTGEETTASSMCTEPGDNSLLDQCVGLVPPGKQCQLVIPWIPFKICQSCTQSNLSVGSTKKRKGKKKVCVTGAADIHAT